MNEKLKFPVEISIDQGGTFTDLFANYGNEIIVEKIPTACLAEKGTGPVEGIKKILQKITGQQDVQSFMHPLNFKKIKMGTTVATNALLERKGKPTVLAITRGFESLLEIAEQNRSDLFQWRIQKPSPIYEKVISVDERLIPGENGPQVLAPLNQMNLRKDLKKLFHEGYESIAIVLMHAFQNPQHENQAGQIARECGFKNICLSHQIMPAIKIVNRGNITVLDAYLNLAIQDYMESFFKAFEGSFEKDQVLFMRSDGSLCNGSELRASEALLSGPAGGFLGYSSTLFNGKALIGYDMGGTSTDVSRFDGEIPIAMEHKIAGLAIKIPHLVIETIAAGGGSQLKFENGLMTVGPLSSGADPGPLCYAKNGTLSLTDANLILNRIIPTYFPKAFGHSGDQPLNRQLSLSGMQDLIRTMSCSEKSNLAAIMMTPEEAALGFVRIANEAMARPILELSTQKGFDPGDHHLVCFGGAGAQHACGIAKILGIPKVLIPFHSGVFSAIGLSTAVQAKSRVIPIHKPLSTETENFIFQEFQKTLGEMGPFCKDFTQKLVFVMRFDGTDNLLRIPLEKGSSPENTFKNRYFSIFGFLPDQRAIWVEEIHVSMEETASHKKKTESKKNPRPSQSISSLTQTCLFEEGHFETPVYLWENLAADARLEGPAIVITPTSTVVINPRCQGELISEEVLAIEIPFEEELNTKQDFETVELSLFQHRFMSLTEQMGRMLQRTSASTNIKERLDFSCALFDQKGKLVANAPHIPVHLGSMSACVRKATAVLNPVEGQVWITNHPAYGGTHLPDITVITPFFHENKLFGFFASRGHHADIGSSSPGSMPANSKSLREEGALIPPTLLVENQKFRENWVIETFSSAGGRLINDNLNDLKAQVSANKRGYEILTELINKHGIEAVDWAMLKIQAIGDDTVRKYLQDLDEDFLSARDQLDDGSEIQLEISIDRVRGEAIFDFTGSTDQVVGNHNAPLAVVQSAVLYCLRCLVAQPIPLNDGLLNPIQIKTRRGSLLDPDNHVGVAAGNVTTSQRIVDTIFKAFGLCAASQGCMNSISFGNDETAYYETIGGGVGAGQGYHGVSGIHTHMTNTKATDPEVLEQNYPLVLQEFSIREESGGNGQFKGGCGLVREIQARVPMKTNLITERRLTTPYGLMGGEPGMAGRNLYWPAGEEKTPTVLESKCSLNLNPGDRIRIETPGGGGYGEPR